MIKVIAVVGPPAPGDAADIIFGAAHDPTLNVTQGLWRGWGMKLTPEGEFLPICAGMRSPSGLGANREGDMFYTDQQGNWVATNTLHHMREGDFYHHPEALASMSQPGSPITGAFSTNALNCSMPPSCRSRCSCRVRPRSGTAR
jgi:hypothetical protein